jgi:hypothetical protein
MHDRQPHAQQDILHVCFGFCRDKKALREGVQEMLFDIKYYYTIHILTKIRMWFETPQFVSNIWDKVKPYVPKAQSVLQEVSANVVKHTFTAIYVAWWWIQIQYYIWMHPECIVVPLPASISTSKEGMDQKHDSDTAKPTTATTLEPTPVLPHGETGIASTGSPTLGRPRTPMHTAGVLLRDRGEILRGDRAILFGDDVGVQPAFTTAPGHYGSSTLW